MSWLALLKNQKDAKTYATKTTKTPQEDGKGVSVVFVAYPQGPFQKKEGEAETPAATPTPTPKDTRKVGEVIQKATRHVLRVERFARLGLPTGEAEALAERLALRDRDFDHRTACAECACLKGRPGAWRCTNWQRAGIGAPAVPGAFVAEMLQHCPGFRAASQMISEKVSEGGF